MGPTKSAGGRRSACQTFAGSTNLLFRSSLRKLPTLRHSYLLVLQELRAAQWHERDADGQWLISDLQGSGTLVLACSGLSVTLSLDDIYGDVTLG